VTAIAKITAKGQTTIPADIRVAMGIGPGDLIAWDITAAGIARVRRIQPADLEYLKAVEATLSEWQGPADEEAYRDL